VVPQTFFPPRDAKNKRIFVEFDGVMANSDVYINGHAQGHRPYGYIGFRYDATAHPHFGDTENVLAVRADNSKQPASRWYAGAGIYRHARLLVLDPVHVDYNATFVTTPRIEKDSATVHLQTTVVNDSGEEQTVSVEFSLVPPQGASGSLPLRGKPQPLPAGKSAEFSSDFTVDHPQLWDLDHPTLYRASAKVFIDDKTVDEQSVTFGIRDAKFDPATGFSLNGKNFKLKGVCLHQDGGAFGVAVPMGVWQRRLATLKELGVNAIRTAHNPPAPEFLDLCDRMGVLVMDENFDCWTVGKNPYDYHLFTSRTGSRPTRATWSAAIGITRASSCGRRETRSTTRRTPTSLSRSSSGWSKSSTPMTRPARSRRLCSGPNVSHDYDDGLADLLDVVGQNYRENEILAAHEQKPAAEECRHGERATIGASGWPFATTNHIAGQFLVDRHRLPRRVAPPGR
jgi:beta-galactosidase